MGNAQRIACAAALCLALVAPPAEAIGGEAPGPPSFATGPPVIPGAEFVGAQTCLDCHEELGEILHDSPHHPRFGRAVPGTEAVSCEACHGPGSLHVEEGGDGPILGGKALRDLDPDGRAGMCLQCHRERRQSWPHSAHQGTEVSCAECHADQTHFGPAIRSVREFRVEGEFCLQCHAGAAASFRLRFHHPVLEGQMGCTDCHDPHGEGALGAAFAEENQACLRCHPAVAGPFVFEHEAMFTESCQVCHQPHGSANDKLLTQDSNSLCLQCHHEPGFPVIGRVDHQDFLSRRARCYDCHAEIHGSNADESFLKP